MFQSTHPRGVRRPGLLDKTPDDVFQSTHPRGVRHVKQYIPEKLKGVSIHAPARGATGGVPVPACHASVSIHAPARGATSNSLTSSSVSLSFNPRTREGCDYTDCS